MASLRTQLAEPRVHVDGERALDRAMLGLRWAGLVGIAAVLLIKRHQLNRPVPGVLFAQAALIVTIVATVLRRRPWELRQRHWRLIELAVGAGLLAADGWVFGARYAYDAPVLPSVWPLAGVVAMGAAEGPVAGAVAGFVLGLAHLVGAPAPYVLGVSPSVDYVINPHPSVMPLVFVVTLFVLAGAGAGLFVRSLRAAASEVEHALDRESLARRLHDGVLQTLALVQRRSTDELVVRSAQESDRELRAYIAGMDDAARADDLAVALRLCARRAGARFSVTVEESIADDLPALPTHAVRAISGAVDETFANIAKHASVDHAVLYAGPDGDGVFISVRDRGTGFDSNGNAPKDRGIARSIVERIEDVGGRAEVRSTPGSGTEVRLWVP